MVTLKPGLFQKGSMASGLWLVAVSSPGLKLALTTSWRNSLSSFQSLLLRICRGGTVFTPTRRYQENSGPCPFCKAPVPSMRHFWADCPRFQSVCASIMLEYGLDAAWFSQQPRCTAKTGFITFQASPSPQRREQMQVATCKLALAILEDTWGSFHVPPGRIVPRPSVSLASGFRLGFHCSWRCRLSGRTFLRCFLPCTAFLRVQRPCGRVSDARSREEAWPKTAAWLGNNPHKQECDKFLRGPNNVAVSLPAAEFLTLWSNPQNPQNPPKPSPNPPYKWSNLFHYHDKWSHLATSIPVTVTKRFWKA